MLLALLALVAPAGVAAQQTPLVQPGVRVRLTLTPDTGMRTPLIGILMRLTPDSVVVFDEEGDAPAGVPVDAVRKLEVDSGRRTSHAGRGTLIGVLAGLGSGIATGILVCSSGNCESSGGDWTGLAAGALGLGGALVGAGIGALIGSFMHEGGWQTVALGDR